MPRSGIDEPGLMQYVGKAFTWKWNLLVFGAAMLGALISGAPDIVVPIVLAGELSFLGSLSTNPKFQKAIAAQEHKDRQGYEVKETRPKESKETRALNKLTIDSRDRFNNLKERCLEMRKLASGIRGEDHIPEDDLHSDSLNKMLWVFLRLLNYEAAMGEYLFTTRRDDMVARLAKLRKRIEKTKSEKILRSLKDSLATTLLRLENYEGAQENKEFIEIELDRIEDKIRALVEMAVSHEDPDYISSQMDSVVQSVRGTEAAMREMSMIPEVNDGIDEEEEESMPSLLSA